MPHPNAAKGSLFESALAKYLKQQLGNAVRPRQAGHKDIGDIHISPFIVQAKNWKDTTAALNEGVKGAEAQAVNAHELYGVAVIKKRNAPIHQARVAMTLATFVRIVLRLRRAEDLLLRADPARYDEHARRTKEESNP